MELFIATGGTWRWSDIAFGTEAGYHTKSNIMEPPGLNKEQWLEKLILVDQSLQRQTGSAQLILMGSAAGILTGQPSRTSIELDVWKPGSQYQYQTLKTAVEEAGLLFDPKIAEPDRPYFQMVEPGLTQLGKFETTECLEQFRVLRLERPPMANPVAAKLVRAEAKDLEDIAYLLSAYRPSRHDIEEAIQSMPREAREKSAENLVYLNAMSRGQ
jgi:hypothetical protein